MPGVAVAEGGSTVVSPFVSPQEGPPFGLHLPLQHHTGFFGQHPALFFAPLPAQCHYMTAPAAAGPAGAAAAHSPPPRAAAVVSMDDLKARIMEAAPGQVKHTICSAQFVPRAAAFTSLIQMAAKAKQPQRAIEIFEAMAAVGVQPNTFSYSALISALARTGRWQEAEGFFEELQAMAQQAPEMKPNTVTFAALISAYEKGGQLGKALAAFQQQLDAGVPPDIITYSSLVTACERAGHTQQACELLDQLHSAGLVANHQLYHGLLTSCQAGGEWELALEVFLGMQCAGVRPTAHTVHLLLGALVAAGQTGHALWLVREALRGGYEMSTPSLNSLLQLLAGRGNWRAALGVYRSMGLGGIKGRPDAASAALLVAACVQGGNKELAEQLASEFAAQGLLQPADQTQAGRPANGDNVQQRQQQGQQQGQGQGQRRGSNGAMRPDGNMVARHDGGGSSVALDSACVSSPLNDKRSVRSGARVLNGYASASTDASPKAGSGRPAGSSSDSLPSSSSDSLPSSSSDSLPSFPEGA